MIRSNAPRGWRWSSATHPIHKSAGRLGTVATRLQFEASSVWPGVFTAAAATALTIIGLTRDDDAVLRHLAPLLLGERGRDWRGGRFLHRRWQRGTLRRSFLLAAAALSTPRRAAGEWCWFK